MISQERPAEEAYGTCDWGNCEQDAEYWRWDDEYGWLPVCADHYAMSVNIVTVESIIPEAVVNAAIMRQAEARLRVEMFLGPEALERLDEALSKHERDILYGDGS
jgi:hypothetical protein